MFSQKFVTCYKCGCAVVKEEAIVKSYHPHHIFESLEDAAIMENIYFCKKDAPAWDILDSAYSTILRTEVIRQRYLKIIPEHYEEINEDGSRIE